MVLKRNFHSHWSFTLRKGLNEINCYQKCYVLLAKINDRLDMKAENNYEERENE